MLLSQVIDLNEMLEAAIVAEDENVLEGLTKVSATARELCTLASWRGGQLVVTVVESHTGPLLNLPKAGSILQMLLMCTNAPGQVRPLPGGLLCLLAHPSAVSSG